MKQPFYHISNIIFSHSLSNYLLYTQWLVFFLSNTHLYNITSYQLAILSQKRIPWLTKEVLSISVVYIRTVFQNYQSLLVYR